MDFSIQQTHVRKYSIFQQRSSTGIYGAPSPPPRGATVNRLFLIATKRTDIKGLMSRRDNIFCRRKMCEGTFTTRKDLRNTRYYNGIFRRDL